MSGAPERDASWLKNNKVPNMPRVYLGWNDAELTLGG